MHGAAKLDNVEGGVGGEKVEIEIEDMLGYPDVFLPPIDPEQSIRKTISEVAVIRSSTLGTKVRSAVVDFSFFSMRSLGLWTSFEATRMTKSWSMSTVVPLKDAFL